MSGKSRGDAKAGAKPARKRGRRDALNEEVAGELSSLRAAVDEMVRRYKVDIAGDLAEFERRLQPDPAQPTKRRPLPVRTAQQVLELIRSTELRPERGRPKDFRRLRKLIRAIGAIWPD